MSNVRWGKRPRDGDGESFVRFSELTAQQKAQRRREERAEKKEHSRTMSYFASIQRALDAQAAQSADPGARSSLVAGFFSELMQQLKADRTLHLLRNGTVCRVIEAALTHAQLLQAKSLFYVLLGRMWDLVTSPVASFVLETTVWAMVHGCIELAKEDEQQNGEQLALEMSEGGAGVHPGSGVPSCATMFRSFVDEICEHMVDIVHHDIAARALRSILFLLGGKSFASPEGRVATHVLGQPASGVSVVFTGAMDQIAESVAQVVQTNFASGASSRHASRKQNGCASADETHDTGDGAKGDTACSGGADEDAASAWLSAAQTPNSSLILQSLVRVAPCGSVTDVVIRQRLAQLQCRDAHGRCQPLLLQLLHHSIGCHVFQAFTAAPVPDFVVAAGDAVALRQQNACTTVGALLASMGVDAVSVDDLVRRRGNTEEDDDDVASTCNDEPSLRQGVLAQYDCCWGKALGILEQTNLDELIEFGSPTVQSMGHVLHDLLLYAPTAVALQLAWTRIVQPRLGVFMACSALSGVLTALTRKCAFAGSIQSSPALSPSGRSRVECGKEVRSSSSAGEGTGLALVPADIDAQLHMDEMQGVRFFDVAVSMQTEVCAAMCAAIVKLDKYGALQYLCAKASLGQRGYELARNVLHMHPSASLPLRESIEKLRQCDLIDLLKHARGSVVFQQLLRASVLHDMSTTSSSSRKASKDKTKRHAVDSAAAASAPGCHGAKRSHDNKDRVGVRRTSSTTQKVPTSLHE